MKGAWVEAVEAKARIIHTQLAAAQSLANRSGGDSDDIAQSYIALLRQLYEDEFTFARMVDSSDLVARFEGSAVEASEPTVTLVMTVFADLRDEIRGIAKSRSEEHT